MALIITLEKLQEIHDLYEQMLKELEEDRPEQLEFDLEYELPEPLEE